MSNDRKRYRFPSDWCGGDLLGEFHRADGLVIRQVSPDDMQPHAYQVINPVGAVIGNRVAHMPSFLMWDLNEEIPPRKDAQSIRSGPE